MKKIFVAGMLALFVIPVVFGQSAAEELAALELRVFSIQDSSSKHLYSKDKSVDERLGKELIARSQKVINAGTRDQVLRARYFKIMGLSRYTGSWSDDKDPNEAVEYLMPFDRDIEDVRTNMTFPVTVRSGGYYINYTFADFISYHFYIFHLTIASYQLLLKNYKEAELHYSRIALEPSMPARKACYGLETVIYIYRDLLQISNATKLEFIYRLISKVTNDLTEIERLEFIANKMNRSLQELGKEFLYDAESFKTSPQIQSEALAIATILDRNPLRSDSIVFGLFRIADLNENNHQIILEYCMKRMHNEIVLMPGEFYDTSMLRREIIQMGKNSLEKTILSSSYGSCFFYYTWSGMFRTFKDETQALLYEERYKECTKLEQEEAKRQNKLRQKTERGFLHIYLGLMPIGAVLNSKYEGHIDLRRRARVTSFGFGLINNNQDWSTRVFNDVKAKDKLRWEGYRANFAMKFFLGDNQKNYTGFMLGYSNKNFKMGPTEATVLTVKGTYDFKPTESQYELYVIMGWQELGRTFGHDMNFGFGISYNRFDGGNAIWGQKGVTINNDFLSTRKATKIYPQFRCAWSFGFHFHSKNAVLQNSKHEN